MSLQHMGTIAIPTVIALVGLFMLRKNTDRFSAFTEGAQSGLRTAAKLLPTLTALLVAIRMVSSCGILPFLGKLLAPLLHAIGVPTELLPLLVTRPLSGSASTAAYAQLIEEVGPDSFPALCASVILGSSDTLLYVISVYFSAVGVTKSRHAYPCAAAVTVLCVFLSCLVCRLWFKA